MTPPPDLCDCGQRMTHGPDGDLVCRDCGHASSTDDRIRSSIAKAREAVARPPKAK